MYLSIILGNYDYFRNVREYSVRFPICEDEDPPSESSCKVNNIIQIYNTEFINNNNTNLSRMLIISYGATYNKNSHVITLIVDCINNVKFCFDSSGTFIDTNRWFPSLGKVNISNVRPQGRAEDCSYWTEAFISFLIKNENILNNINNIDDILKQNLNTIRSMRDKLKHSAYLRSQKTYNQDLELKQTSYDDCRYSRQTNQINEINMYM